MWLQHLRKGLYWKTEQFLTAAAGVISNALFLHLACCDVVMLEHCALHACLPAFPFGFLQFLSAYLCLTCDFTSWRNRVHVKSCVITVKRTGICSKLPKLKEAMSVLWQEQACSTSSKSLTLWPHKTVLSPISSFLPHWLERLHYKTIRLIKQTLFISPIWNVTASEFRQHQHPRTN